mmetsp:Transcript_4227/g.9681  ORF Transcript_4227/g.9681 Transcript_4227/m.9681 type:complete len:223 (+) Transcript_4227:171-839(+)
MLDILRLTPGIHGESCLPPGFNTRCWSMRPTITGGQLALDGLEPRQHVLGRDRSGAVLRDHELPGIGAQVPRLARVLNGPPHELLEVGHGWLRPTVPFTPAEGAMLDVGEAVDVQRQRALFGEVLGGAAPVGGDHRQAHGHRLHGGPAPALATGWQDKGVGHLVQQRQVLQGYIIHAQRVACAGDAGAVDPVDVVVHLTQNTRLVAFAILLRLDDECDVVVE